MSDSVWPQRRQPTRLPHPWDSPGKNTGVGCHFLLRCMKVKSESEVAQSCLTPSDSMDCSLPGSSIHGIFQARVLEWVAIAFSGRSDYYWVNWEVRIFFTGDTAVAKTMEEYWLFKESQECKVERRQCRVTVVRQQAENADDLKNMEVL